MGGFNAGFTASCCQLSSGRVNFHRISEETVALALTKPVLSKGGSVFLSVFPSGGKRKLESLCGAPQAWGSSADVITECKY